MSLHWLGVARFMNPLSTFSRALRCYASMSLSDYGTGVHGWWHPDDDLKRFVSRNPTIFTTPSILFRVSYIFATIRWLCVIPFVNGIVDNWDDPSLCVERFSAHLAALKPGERAYIANIHVPEHIPLHGARPLLEMLLHDRTVFGIYVNNLEGEFLRKEAKMEWEKVNLTHADRISLFIVAMLYMACEPFEKGAMHDDAAVKNMTDTLTPLFHAIFGLNVRREKILWWSIKDPSQKRPSFCRVAMGFVKRRLEKFAHKFLTDDDGVYVMEAVTCDLVARSLDLY